MLMDVDEIRVFECIEFELGDHVFYPHHGAGKVEGKEEMEVLITHILDFNPGMTSAEVVMVANVSGQVVENLRIGYSRIGIGVLLPYVPAGDRRPQRPEVKDLLLAHLVRNHQGEVVTSLRRHQRQPQPGVPGRGLR